MSEHWPAIAARLRKLGIAVKILTNGLLLSQDTVGRLRDLGVNGVGLSLDGPAPLHDRLRGQEGLFDHILAGMRMIRESGLPLTVITTVNTLNLGDLEALSAILVEEDVRQWQLQPLFHLGRGADNAWLQLAKEEFLRFGDFVSTQAAPARDRGLEIMPSDSFGYFTHRDRREPAWGGCPAGQFSCGITSDGRIKGCLSLPDNLGEGDLRQRSLWDIWFDPDAFSYTRRFAKNDLGPNCESCDRAEQCQGGCSAMSYGCTGRFHNDPFCFYGIAKGQRADKNSRAI